MLLFLSGYFDSLDGAFARFTRQTSNFGSALDIICDRIVECALVVAMYQMHTEVSPLFSLLMLASILICVTTFLVVGIFAQNTGSKNFYYSPGLIERGEAFIFFGLMICFPPLFPLLALVFSLLVLFTGALRTLQFYRSERTPD